MIKRKCKYCNNESIMTQYIFANHVRNCINNPKKYIIQENSKNAVVKYFDNLLGELKDFKVKCSNTKCQKHFIVNEREKQFPKKSKYFCSRSCANSRNHSKKTKEKISKSNKNYSNNNKLRGQSTEIKCVLQNFSLKKREIINYIVQKNA